MNSHEQIKELLVDYALGELPEQRSAEVKNHLAKCPTCRQEHQRLMALEETTQNIRRLTVDQKTHTISQQSLTAAIAGQDKKTITTKSKPDLVDIWRMIMKSKFSKLAATAAAVLIFAVIGLWPDQRRLYGMSDALELLQSAQTLHFKGYVNVNIRAGKLFEDESPKPNYEVWLDQQNQQVRMMQPTFVRNGEKITVWLKETVSDGEFLMTLDHRDQTAAFTLLEPKQQKILWEQSWDELTKQVLGDPALIDDYVLIGAETISGTEYNIWQVETEIDPATQTHLRISSWLSPDQGEFGRIHIWQKTGQGEWLKLVQINQIERDITLPADIFLTETPENYIAKNNKETTPKFKINTSMWAGKALGLGISRSFALENGCVIFAWSSSRRKSGEFWSQDNWAADIEYIHLFEQLQPGGPLAELPIVISGLKCRNLWGDKPVYQGYHLAYTQKDDQLYEWGIYIPRKKVPRRTSMLGYDVVCRFNPEDNATEWTHENVSVKQGLVIDKDNFADLLLVGMGQLSDSGEAPENISYDFVMELSKKIQESIRN